MRRRIAIILSVVMLGGSVSLITEILKKDISAGTLLETPPASASTALRDTLATPSGISRIDHRDVIYNVSFPANTTAYLNPGDLSGRGQIFSESFQIENYGNTDVAIYIKNINIYYSSEEDVYQLSENEITDIEPRVKKMNINMVWENESEQIKTVLNLYEGVSNVYVISLRAAGYGENGEFAELHEGSKGHFYFTGTLNANPNIEWSESEMTVTFDYEIVNIDGESGNWS